MAEMLINNWEGIGNDEYLQQGSELFDARDIDFSSTRRIKSIGAYDRKTAFRTGASSTLRKATTNTYTTVLSYSDDAKVWDGTTLRSIGYGSNTHVTVGVGNGAYDEATASSNMRHFFFPYNAGRIVYTNYNATTIATIDVSATPRLNDSSLAPGASCYIWKGAILFSYGNGIHEVNPSPNTPTYSGEKVTLPNGAQVKHIAYFGGLIWFVYTITGKNSTFIQGCQYTGTTYTLSNYVTEISGQVCLGAISDSSMIYWVSEFSINEFNGSQNTVVKTLYEKNGANDYFISQSGGAECVCSYNNGFLRVTGVNKVYLYGNKRTGFKKNLTEIKLDTGFDPLALANDGLLITNDSGNHRLATVDTTYNATSYVVTVPYTAGRYSAQKSGLGIRVGYSLEETSGGSISIKIITDRIIRDNGGELYSDYIELASITDATKTYYDITPQMIANILGTAGYSNEFSLMKLIVELTNGGSVASVNLEVRYSNSPEVFDLYIYHDEVK